MSADTQPAAAPGPCARCGHSEREHTWNNAIHGGYNRVNQCGECHALPRDGDELMVRFKFCECAAYTPQEPPVTQPDEKASYVANPEHWRSRCEMLETEVERFRKGAMQRAKEWMESAAEALAQENENARLREQLAAEKRRVERVRALADNWSTDAFGAYGEVDGRPLAAEIYAALADEAAK